MRLPFLGRRSSKLDLTAIALAPLGVMVVIASQLVAGAPLGTLLRAEAALIVIGGTLAALLLSHSPRELVATVRAAAATFLIPVDEERALAKTMIALAGVAHRRGLVAVETDLEGINDVFLREGVSYAIDEPSAQSLRHLLTVETAARASAEEAPARLFETAAGYAPTLGILGAVLGLIDVMRHLTAPSALGGGIAVAFAATVYGVGLANLLLLPLAGRLRQHACRAARRRELVTHGVCAIHQRMHPRALAHTFRAYGIDIADEGPGRVNRTELRGRIPA